MQIVGCKEMESLAVPTGVVSPNASVQLPVRVVRVVVLTVMLPWDKENLQQLLR